MDEHRGRALKAFGRNVRKTREAARRAFARVKDGPSPSQTIFSFCKMVDSLSIWHMETASSIKAQKNEKMLELRIRFWTNDLAETEGEIIPKHAWDSGVVVMDRNLSHGIEPGSPTPFGSTMGLLSVIEKVLISHGIRLHPSKKSRKYTELS